MKEIETFSKADVLKTIDEIKDYITKNDVVSAKIKFHAIKRNNEELRTRIYFREMSLAEQLKESGKGYR